MFVLAVIVVNTMGQSFVDERLELLKGLPPDQFESARQIILLGGDVWPPDGKVAKVFVESITFRGEKFTDAEIPLLAPFRGTPLSGIGFVRARLTEAGIAHALADFPELRSVTVFHMPIGDAALAPLARFNRLENVSLGESRITSASLRHMAHQPQLEYLSVQDTGVDDDGLKHLEGLAVLKSLALGKTRITTAGLASICKLLNLETLTLKDTKIEDEELKCLATLKRLQTLGLDGTQVTNAGMAYVAKLSSLTELYVGRTKVDAKGLALLQNMPQLREVRWLDDREPTLEEKRFDVRFQLYLPANLERWKEHREKFERGELEIK